MRLRSFVTKLGRKARRAAGATVGVAVLSGGLFFAGPASAELIVNGGFETNNGFNADNDPLAGGGWTTIAGTDTTLGFDVYNHNTQAYYTGPAPAGAGDWYFHSVGLGTLTTTPAVVAQDVDVTGLDGQPFLLSGNFAGGSYNDAPIVEIEFNDGGATTHVLDGSIANATDDNIDGSSPRDHEKWGLYSVTDLIPAGATSAQVRILQAAVSGTSGNGNDNYVDNLSLTIIPEPSTLALLGLGGIGLAGLARRKK